MDRVVRLFLHQAKKRARVKPSTGQYKITERSDRDYGMTGFHSNDPNAYLIVGRECSGGDSNSYPLRDQILSLVIYDRS